MKIKSRTPGLEGFSLVLVLVFTGVLFLLLSGVLAWTTTHSNLTQRYNEYYDGIAAAEAATEKVVASIAADFQSSGVNGVDANLANYGATVPTPGEVSDWAGYEFDDPSGAQNATYVSKLTAWQYSDLNWKYAGFKGSNSVYRVISNARNTASRYNITSAVKQEIQIVSIPLFEFGVFYSLDMELCALWENFTVPGRVHCNGTIYSMPNQVTVTFSGDVTAAQKILATNSPSDPYNNRTLGTNIYQREHDWNVSSLNLPLGTNNNPINLHALIEIPPGTELTSSLMGLQRYYNKADLILLVSNTNVTARSGAYNGFATTIDWTNINSFVNTNVSFNDARESKTIKATQIDVAKFATNSNYNNLSSLLGRPVKTLYVADLRTQISSTKPGVRLVNGKALPAAGLTVATLNPLYVLGHYNAPNSSLGTNNTSQTVPASLVADAFTVLSGGWTDPNGGSQVNDTTVNAAVLAGIVPSDGSNFSGGVENFLRLLENWNSHTLTFNGSMAALFPSQTATSPWEAGSYYFPPVRMFSFDPNFLDNTMLPPGTPWVRTIVRSSWNITQANSTQ
ncbi:MAG: hypothetical protein DME19_01325 [Verrucomicrobia bacterium]|nr:MAG: hypothetical protein DME19_01325 [Verrucomicrobiota bacterium]